jgi:ATP-dependent Clp protease ATP-binding subunit ClpA
MLDTMTLDEAILAEARSFRERMLELQRDTEKTRVDFHHSVRRLHAAGGSLREIADVLGLSHQRVHQIVDGDESVQRRLRLKRRRERSSGPLLRRFSGDALRSLAASPEAIKARVVVAIGRGEEGPAGEMPFTPRTKKAFELALREALSRGDSEIDTEHLALAIVSLEECVAAKLLAEIGIGRRQLEAALANAK